MDNKFRDPSIGFEVSLFLLVCPPSNFLESFFEVKSSKTKSLSCLYDVLMYWHSFSIRYTGSLERTLNHVLTFLMYILFFHTIIKLKRVSRSFHAARHPILQKTAILGRVFWIIILHCLRLWCFCSLKKSCENLHLALN